MQNQSTAARQPRAALMAFLWTLALGAFWMLLELFRILTLQSLVDLPTDLARFLRYLPWQLAVFAGIGLPLAVLVRLARPSAHFVAWLRFGAAIFVFLGPSAAVGAYRASREPLLALVTAFGVAVSIGIGVTLLAAIGRVAPRAVRDAWPMASAIGFSFVLVPMMSRASAPLRLGRLDLAELVSMTRPIEWLMAFAAIVVCLGLITRVRRAGGAGVRASAVLLAALGLAATGPDTASAGRTQAPDVVVILIDALRADVVGASRGGRPVTPNLDAIASESIVFNRTYAAANRTARSMPAIMTSLSAPVVGESLANAAKTLAEHLRQAGYSTYGISANPHVSVYYNYDQGFDGFHDPTVAPDYLVMNPLKILGQLSPGLGYHSGLISAQLYYPTASEVRSRGAAALLDTPGPAFLYLHMMDLHGPYLPPASFLTDDYDPSHFVSYFELLARLVKGSLDLDRDRPALLNARQRYEGELRFADREVGRLVELLRGEGRWDETLVWILSDHGEAFGEHGWVGHSGSNVFPTLLRVPMMLKPPRSSGLRPATVEDLASTFDVLPTTLSIVGIESEEPQFGIDLADSSRGTATASRRAVFSDSFAPEGRLVSCIEGAWQMQALVSRETHEVTPSALFDLERDPLAAENRIAEYPAIAERLLGAIEQRVAEERRLSIRSESKATDPSVLELLQSLGYAE